MPDEDWSALATAVAARRVSKGYRYATRFSEATGFGVRTLNDIENARRTSYDRSTLLALDSALGWAAGSSEAVLRGGTPTDTDVVPEPDSAGYVSYRPDGGPSLRDATKDELLEEVARRMRSEAEGR